MNATPPSADGGGLQRAVEVMDLLRSPGGCAWDAAQTHESLTRYLVEESYEVLEAIETGDRTLLREELGDLLLQVLFHARLAQELPPGEAFGIDEIAGDLTDKLIRRHPHVFARDEIAEPDGVADLDDSWEARKIQEKGRTSALDGVPIAQPALALTAKLISRVSRAGLDVTGPISSADTADMNTVDMDTADTRIGTQLFEIVRAAVALGVDPEGALRRATADYRHAIRAAETAG